MVWKNIAENVITIKYSKLTLLLCTGVCWVLQLVAWQRCMLVCHVCLCSCEYTRLPAFNLKIFLCATTRVIVKKEKKKKRTIRLWVSHHNRLSVLHFNLDTNRIGQKDLEPSIGTPATYVDKSNIWFVIRAPVWQPLLCRPQTLHRPTHIVFKRGTF